MSVRKKSAANWSTQEAHRIAGITYRQLDYWIRTGLIKPTMKAKGHGSKHGFSYRDLVAVRAIAALKETGVSLQAVRRVQSALIEFDGDDNALRAGRLIIEGGTNKPDVAIACSDDEVLSLLKRPGQHQMRTVFEMARVYDDVREAISSLEINRSKSEQLRRAG